MKFIGLTVMFFAMVGALLLATCTTPKTSAETSKSGTLLDLTYSYNHLEESTETTTFEVEIENDEIHVPVLEATLQD